MAATKTETPETPWFLVKGDVLLGRCVKTPGQGWRFLPNVTSHKPSRKPWPGPVECIPSWAFDLSTDFLTLEEWEKKQATA